MLVNMITVIVLYYYGNLSVPTFSLVLCINPTKGYRFHEVLSSMTCPACEAHKTIAFYRRLRPRHVG